MAEPTTTETASEASAPKPDKPAKKPAAKKAPEKAGKANSRSGGKATNTAKGTNAGARKRVPRPYPVVAFKQATVIGEAIHKYAAGENIRRLTLLEKLKFSATSSSTQMLITNSGKYGITTGSYASEFLELTPLGKIACDPSASARQKLDARFKLSIEGVAPFKLLYESGVAKKLVAREVMADQLDAANIVVDDKSECTDIYITNLQDLGLLRTIGGSETIIPIAQALEETGEALPVTGTVSVGAVTPESSVRDWDKVCFYVTPIGDVGTEIRKHSDLFKSSIVEPAMAELGLTVVRADEVGTPGMIATSIIEHIKRSKLVIADLSLLNPNVFYEIALRHACRLPIVQIKSAAEKIPFDVSQVNTMPIDNTSLYTFVPKIETYRSELAALARSALKDPAGVSNPITVFYPGFWDK